MKRHIWQGIKMVLVLAFIGFVIWAVKLDCPNQAYGQFESPTIGLVNQSVKGDHIDSTSEDFVFNDAFRIKSSEDDSMFMTKKYIDDMAGGLVAQSVKGDHVDSTDEDFVFNDAFRITSVQAESIFITKNHVEKAIHGTLWVHLDDTSAVLWGAINDSTYYALDAAGDTLWAHLDDTSGVLWIAITDSVWMCLGAISGSLWTYLDESTAVLWTAIHDTAWMVKDAIGDTLWTHLDESTAVLWVAVKDTAWMLRGVISDSIWQHLDDSTAVLWTALTDTSWTLRDAIHDTTWAHLDDSMAVLWTAVTDTTWMTLDAIHDTMYANAPGYLTASDSATAFILVSYDNPTTDAEGEMSWDSNDDAFEVYMGDEGESALIPAYQKIDALIFAPDGVNDEIAIMHVDALLYPHGIEIDQVSITLPADAEYSMIFEEWSGDPPVAQNDIETVTTTATDAYMEVGGGDIDDAAIDADDYIFLHVPSTDVDWIHIQVIYHINDGD